MNPAHSNIQESLEHGDLKRVLRTTLHIDEFKSKMGDDNDICVISFKIMGKNAAEDLVNFIEKGYKWVLDADSSPGEMGDGDYIVFVEIERTGKLPEQILELMSDLMNLTLQDLDDWEFLYHKSQEYLPLTRENLISAVPLSSKRYQEMYTNEPVKEMKLASGLPVESQFQKTPDLDLLQVWAGIK